ncbi:type II secretion system protein [candidate division WOR-3 bacterium]|nr:type II secretion system protein [candidate division WOR-3 bacterium]
MKKKKGFTLIELIVSVLIFSIAMTGIVMFSAMNSRSVSQSEKKARMAVQAEKAFEDLKAMVIRETPSGEELIFDSIWVNSTIGDTIYQTVDTIKGMILKSVILLDSFEFKEDNPIASGSRVKVLLITHSSFGDVDTSFITISRHR